MWLTQPFKPTIRECFIQPIHDDFGGLLIGFVTLVIMTMSILFDVFSEDADADVDYSQCGINNDYEDADGDDNE